MGGARGRAHGHLHVTLDSWPELLGVGRGPGNGVVRWRSHCEGKREILPSNSTEWLDLTKGVACVAWSWAR